MAWEKGIEKISTCKKAVHFSLFSTLALGCLFCLQKVLSSMKRPIGKYTGMLPEVLACLFCVFVFVCLSACLHLCLCVRALRHTLLQPCSLRISLQEWDPTRIRNTFSFVPFKQVADCFNQKKNVNLLWIKIWLHSTAILKHPRTVSCPAETNCLNQLVS